MPNWDFSDRLNPLNGWRIDFPYSEVYRANASYMKISDSVRDGDTPALVADLPPGIADNQGARVESGFIKIVPGATYHSSVDVMTNDLAAKIYVEVYALDPSEPGPVPSIDRIPAMNGMPALVKCYRAVFPNPPDQSKSLVYRQERLHGAEPGDDPRQAGAAGLRDGQSGHAEQLGGREGQRFTCPSSC